MKVELTKDQCENIAEIIEWHFFDLIRDDTSIDNINWAKSVLTAHTALEEAAKNGNNDENT